MARTLYGGSAADVAVKLSSDGDFEPDTTSAADAYTTGPSTSGGTHMTDLAAFQPGTPGTPGGAVTTVVAQTDGEILVWGPDPYNGPFWLQYATGPRRQLFPVDLVSRLVTVESGVGGVPSTIVDAKGDLIAATADNTVARLPVGANGTVLEADSAQSTGVKWGTAPVKASLIDAKGDLIAGTAADTVARLAVGTDGKVLTADSTATAGVSWQTPGSTSGFALASGSVGQFADVPDTAPVDGEALVGDGSGGYALLNVNPAVDAIDPSTGDLNYSAFAPFMILGFIKNEGDPDPAGLPLGEGIPVIGWQRPAAASIIPIFDDDGVAATANNTTIVTTQDYAVGDDLLFAVGLSDEAGTAGADATAVFSFSGGGPAAAQTLRIAGRQSATAKVIHYQGKCTVHIPVGTTVTVTFKDVTGTTTQNRAIAAAQLHKMPNLLSTDFDQSVGVNAAGSGTLNLSIGPTGATAQASELAMMSLFMSGGGPPAIRSIAGTNGWALLKHTESDGGSGSRILATFYKVLSAVGAVTGTVTVTSTDSQTGGWAGVVSTWKG